MDPIELVALPLGAFREPGQSLHVARVKHDAFEAIRIATLQKVNAERLRLVEIEESGGQLRDDTLFRYAPRVERHVPKSSAELASAAQAERLASAAVQRDRAQLAAIQARAQQEIETVILHELHTQRAQDERDARNRADAARADALKAEAEERRAEYVAAQARLARDRAEREAAEQSQLREVQAKKLAADQKRAAIEARREAEYRDANRRKEIQIRAKAEVRKARHGEALRAHEAAVAEKKRRDDEAERARQQRLAEQKARTAAQNAARREKMLERVRAAASAHEHSQAQLARQLLEREAEAEERRLRWEAAKAEYLAMVAARSAEKQAKANGLLRELERSNDKYADAVLEKQAAAEGNRKSFHAQLRESLDRRAASRSMALFERHLTVDRSARRDEYARACLGEKLAQTDERISSIRNYREQSLRERRALANRTAQQKEELAERVERMRLTKVFELPPEMRANIRSPELRTLFDMCDRDGTGKIALADVQEAVKSLSQQGRITRDGHIIPTDDAAEWAAIRRGSFGSASAVERGGCAHADALARSDSDPRRVRAASHEH